LYDQVLRCMRDKIREENYIMTLHARREMNNDCLSILDVENCILHGDISERQQDQETAVWKYRICWQMYYGCGMEVIAKLSLTGKLVIITVYRTYLI
jgi:hypothetical protein